MGVKQPHQESAVVDSQGPGESPAAQLPAGGAPGDGEVRWATSEEVLSALNSLTRPDMLRLGKAASRFAYAQPLYGAEDLVAEAMASALRGAQARAEGRPEGRAWRVNVPFIAYLMMTIRGLAADARLAADNRRTVRVDITDEEDDRHPDQRQLESPSPEAELIAEQTLAALGKSVAEDPEIQAILDGLAGGLTPEQIWTRYGMTQQQFDSAKRRLRRRLRELGAGSR